MESESSQHQMTENTEYGMPRSGELANLPGDWCCAYSPDGKRIVCGSNDRGLKVLDAETGREIVTVCGSEHAVNACAYSPDGRQVASALFDGTLKLWDVETGREVATLAGHKGRVTACTYSPDGRRVLSASFDETLKVWNT